MRLFASLARAAIATVTLPVAVVKDVATLAGSLTGRDEPYTCEKVKDIADDLDDSLRSE